MLTVETALFRNVKFGTNDNILTGKGLVNLKRGKMKLFENFYLGLFSAVFRRIQPCSAKKSLLTSGAAKSYLI